MCTRPAKAACMTQVIEHDDEELSSSAELSPMSSCAAAHAFSSLSCGAGALTAALSSHAAAAGPALDEDMGFGSPARLTQGRLPSGEGCGRRTVTSSMATMRGSQALLEAAVSSSLVHPNIVEVPSLCTPLFTETAAEKLLPNVCLPATLAGRMITERVCTFADADV